MKTKILFISLFLITTSLFATNLTYKENSKIQTISVEQDGEIYIVNKSFFSVKSFDNKKLFIKYTEVTPEIVDNIEAKFNFKEYVILSTGEFVYTLDNEDIFFLCANLANEETISTVKPVINSSVKMF